MAEFLVKLADERGRLAQQVEQGYSESEVRERFVQQGYLVYWLEAADSRAQSQAEPVCHLQPAVPDLDQSGAADPEFARSAHPKTKRQESAEPFAKYSRTGEGRRVAFRCLRGPARFPQDLHDHAAGGRKEWQHGRGARSLYRLPAAGVNVQEEAGGFAGLSRAAGDGSAMHADVFDHLRSAPVCEAL